MQVYAGECMHRHANGVQEVRGAYMGFAHGRDDGKSPRPDFVRSDPVASYGGVVFVIVAGMSLQL